VPDQPGVLDEVLAPGLTRRWALGPVRHAEQTPYQRVLVVETSHGTTLFCDDERQSAAATQLVYHEALFVPAVLLAARCERVLVVGSSEGVVSQLAVAAGARLVDHVDIDPQCVRACATHLPYGYAPAELAAAERHEGPVHVHYADGHAFVEEAAVHPGGGGYDVVVVDLPDERPDEPDAQINRLYGAGFLRRCADLLADGGVVVGQAGSPALWRNATLRAAWDRFHAVFPQVVPFVSDEHEWVFLSGRRAATTDPVEDMVARLGGTGLRPTSIDEAALRSRTVAPYHLRNG
jgi:spermidine synthase